MGILIGSDPTPHYFVCTYLTEYLAYLTLGIEVPT
jgi:hypothetical protein